MKIKIIIIIITAVILMLAFLIIGVVFGFPWEHYIAVRETKKYVEEKYQLTPIKATYNAFILNYSTGPYVTISTEEWDFKFEVYTGRIRPINEFRDNYLEKLSEYYLAKDLDEYTKEITNDQGMAFTTLFVDIKDKIAISEMQKNPQIVFEKLQDTYWCRITLYDDITKKDYNIDYELIYNIYNKMIEIGSQPKDISFSYRDRKGSKGEQILSVRIDKKHFPDINSPEDFKPFFDKAIMEINQK